MAAFDPQQIHAKAMPPRWGGMRDSYKDRNENTTSVNILNIPWILYVIRVVIWNLDEIAQVPGFPKTPPNSELQVPGAQAPELGVIRPKTRITRKTMTMDWKIIGYKTVRYRCHKQKLCYLSVLLLQHSSTVPPHGEVVPQ